MPQPDHVDDVNQDGLLDLITANEGDDTVSVLLGRGAGQFGPQMQFPVTARFPTPMDARSFSLSEDVTGFTGPDGPITPSGFTWINHRTLGILFPLQARAGDYEMILGPAILDAAGNPMEQPYLASFHVIVAAWQNPANRSDVDADGDVTHGFRQQISASPDYS